MTANSNTRPDDVVFDDVDRKYICPICLTVFWEPIQTICGHRFCKQCILGVIRENALLRWRYCKCPVDNHLFCFKDGLFEDKAFQREVLSLKVKCKNHNLGCTWNSELREYKDHLVSCMYIQEDCEYGCGLKTMRREQQIHQQICEQRPVECEHCTETITYADLTKHQVLTCAHFPVQCTLCGQTGIRRKDISAHIDATTGDCPQTIIPCRYASYGCIYQGKRRCMTDHYKADSDQHILLLVQHNSVQDRKIAELTSRVSQLQDVVDKFINIGS